jgi:hypothetical protein
MYKATAKRVNQLRKWGKDNEVVAKMIKDGTQPRIEIVAYYHPSNANWNWEIGIAQIDGVLYELLTQFGSVMGGREIWLPKYDKKNIEALN